MKARTTLILIIGLLLLLSLACQTGEVLTPAEATARAREARSVKLGATPTKNVSGTVAPITGPQIGDSGELIGKGFMVNLYQQAGATRIIAQQERGTTVTFKDKQEVNGEMWYLIDAPTGLGWVKAENIKFSEAAGEAEAADATKAASGPQVGDTLYLKGKGFMVNLYQEAGGTRIIAQQERGAAVVFKDAVDVNGVQWYLIDAPTGLGWVPADNTTPEAP
ncbi:MAG: hypothetical protein GXP37_06795 [Chloroflexi bacterium]|nr:hypothetical protein [Chloroflexota bacterium]